MLSEVTPASYFTNQPYIWNPDRTVPQWDLLIPHGFLLQNDHSWDQLVEPDQR